MISNYPDGDAFRTYWNSFVRSRDGPFAIQHPGREWATRSKKISDPLVRDGHLSGKYWLALKAPWYPRYGFFDIDCPNVRRLQMVIEKLNLTDGQYLKCTSPSWRKDGSIHIQFKPRYHDEPVTQKLLLTILKPVTDELGIELYPQIRRKFRLPYGRDQYIIDDESGRPRDDLSWNDSLYWSEKIDPLELSEISGHQLQLPFPAAGFPCDWHRAEYVHALLEYGLQAPNTRHEACFTLAQHFYRSNLDPADAEHKIRRWIRHKHNGYSRTIKAGNWRIVYAEISRQINWVWDHYGRSKIYPDTTHNLEGWVTGDDLKFITQIFPGDIVNQKRLFKLLLYYRPRQHHDWVFVSWRQWTRIASEHNYIDFRARLVEIGLLECNHTYRHVESQPGASYPKRFRLNVQRVSASNMLKNDGRACQDYFQALNLILTGVSVQAEFTGIDRRNFYPDRRPVECDKMQGIYNVYMLQRGI